MGLFVYLTATLGTRCAETVALRAEDFDEANRLVHIRRSVSKTPGRPTIKEPKSGFPRELPIDDEEFWKFVRPHLDAAARPRRSSTRSSTTTASPAAASAAAPTT